MQLSSGLVRGAGLLAVGKNASVKLSSYIIEGNIQLECDKMSASIPKVKFKALF